MRYYANPSTDTIRAAMRAGLLGLIATPHATRASQHVDGVPWIADNAAFGNYPGDDQWFGWLTDRADRAATCSFAVAPDVVGDAAATLIRSTPWFGPIRDLGFPVALAGQDGLENAEIPWGEFDALFLGGSTEWKLGRAAAQLTDAAQRRGVPVHMGRVNSFRRLMYADAIGCSSVDGTYLTYGPDVNLRRLLAWLRFHADNPTLV